ncbi:MAG: hypothetical protein ABL866_14335 [Devosia sp.]
MSLFPDNLRVRPNAEFAFFEMSYAFGRSAGSVFTSLAKAASESAFRFLVIEPDPIEYYEKSFGQAADLVFSTSSDTAAIYANLMAAWPLGSPADAPRFRADIVSWSSPSGLWWGWGEREFNLCAIGTDDRDLLDVAIDSMALQGIPSFTTEGVLANIVSLEIPDQDRLKSFGARLVSTLGYGRTRSI